MSVPSFASDITVMLDIEQGTDTKHVGRVQEILTRMKLRDNRVGSLAICTILYHYL